MKKINWFFLLIIIFSSLAATENRIAVLDFKSENVATPELRVITNRMRTSLVKHDFLQVMERSKIKDLLQEQSYQYQDYFSDEEAVKAGKMVGANYIMAGSLQELENSYYLSARLIEVETTTTYAQQDIIVVNKKFSAILDKVPVLAYKIVKQFADKKEIKLDKSFEEQISIQSKKHTQGEKISKSDISSDTEEGSEYTGKRGGIGPCAASCLIGPRVGLEMNEGKDIRTSEWIALGGSMVGSGVTTVPGASAIPFLTRAYMAYEMGYMANGIKGCIASFVLGPRIGNELDTRRIREKEWMRLIPCINIYPLISIPLEAYRGETMSEIAKREGLRKK